MLKWHALGLFRSFNTFYCFNFKLDMFHLDIIVIDYFRVKFIISIHLKSKFNNIIARMCHTKGVGTFRSWKPLHPRAFDEKKRLVLKLSVPSFQPVGRVKSVAIKYAFRSCLPYNYFVIDSQEFWLSLTSNSFVHDSRFTTRFKHKSMRTKNIVKVTFWYTWVFCTWHDAIWTINVVFGQLWTYFLSCTCRNLAIAS